MATVGIIGGTGLVGTQIVNTLLAHPAISHIDYLARRKPSDETTEQLSEAHPGKLSRFISTEPPATWASHIKSAIPKPEIFFSSLATTRANAGGFAPQYALEHDANLELARAAKEAGAKVYVLISSAGADPKAVFPYARMKGEIERDVIDMGFEKTVIVRPGLLLGNREESRPMEAALVGTSKAIGSIGGIWLRDWWSQDATEIGRSAVSAGVKALKGTGEEGQQKVRYVYRKDIIRLGRTEWDGS